MGKFYIIGGYAGMKSKYKKRITEDFNSEAEAQAYKEANRVFSLSLDLGTIVEY